MSQVALGSLFIFFMLIDLDAETSPLPCFDVQSYLLLSSLISWCLLSAEGKRQDLLACLPLLRTIDLHGAVGQHRSLLLLGDCGHFGADKNAAEAS